MKGHSKKQQAEAAPKKKNLKTELKKLIKDSGLTNFQVKLSSKNIFELIGGFSFNNVQSNVTSVKDVEKVKLSDLEKYNDLKDEFFNLNEELNNEDEELEVDCQFQEENRVYIKGDTLLPIKDIFSYQSNSNIKLSFDNNSQEVVLVFGLLQSQELEIKTLDRIAKVLENKNSKIYYIFCPEVDQILVEDDGCCGGGPHDHDDHDSEEEEEKEVTKFEKINFKEMLKEPIENVIQHSKSEGFVKNLTNNSIEFYYFESLNKENQSLNSALDLLSLTENKELVFHLTKNGEIINIANELEKLYEISETNNKKTDKNLAVVGNSISEKEINQLRKKFESIELGEDIRCVYEFITYNLYFKSVFLINDKNIEKVKENVPCIRYLLSKKHEFVHEEVKKLLEEKKLYDKFDIKGLVVEPKNEITKFLSYFKGECEKNGININPEDIQVDLIRKIKNTERKKKINFKVILKEENNNKEYFQKISKVKDAVSKAYSEKNSTFQIFNKINVVENFKEGDKFVKIPALVDLEGNEKFVHHPQGKIFVLNFFQVIFDHDHCPIIAQNLLIHENKEKWGDKVKFAGITSYSKIKLTNYIKQNNLQNFDFYLEKDNFYCADYLYEKKGKYPDVIIVNKTGTIVYSGELDETVDIESIVNTLLNTDEEIILNEEKIVVKAKTKQNLSLSSAAKLLKPLGRKFDKFYTDELESNIEYQFKFKFLLEKRLKFDSDFKIVGEELSRIVLNTHLYEKEKEILENYLNNEVYPTIPKEYFDLSITVMKEVHHTLSRICNNCNEKLEKSNFYNCYWCKISFCEKCGEKKDETKLGVERYSHPHNLIFINSKIYYNNVKLELHKLGNNLCEKLNNVNFDECEKFSECNGCRKYIQKGFRFLCLGCVPGYREEGYNDICEKCFVIMKNPTHKKYKLVMNNLSGFQHEQNTHSLLRIVYDKSYFEY